MAPAAPASDCISAISGATPQRLVLPRLAHSSHNSAIGELGVIGKMAIVSLTRKATDAAASFPSTVMSFLDIVHLRKATKNHKRNEGNTVRIASNKTGKQWVTSSSSFP